MKKKQTSNQGYILIGIFIGIILMTIFVQLELSPQWVKDQTCGEMIYNATVYGYDTALFQILNETLKCDAPVPINIGNETYNIFAVECLNLNNQGGNK